MPRLNVDALRQQRGARDGFPSAVSRVQGLSLSRRSFIAGSAAALANSSPSFAKGTTFGLFDPPYSVRARSGASWTIDLGRFDGSPALTVVESGPNLVAQLKGVLLAGTDLPADFTCSYDRTSDVLHLEQHLFGLRGRVVASDWIAGTSLLSSEFRPGRWRLHDELELGAERGGIASLKPDWSLSLEALDGAWLGVRERRLPIENARLDLIRPMCERYLVSAGRRGIAIAAEGRGCWDVELSQMPQEMALACKSARFNTATVEFGTDEVCRPCYALVLDSTGNHPGQPITISLAVDEEEDRISMSASSPRLALLRAPDRTEALYLAEAENGVARLHMAGCSIDFECYSSGRQLVLSSINGESHSIAFDGVPKRAALPIDGAASLLVEQPVSSNVKFGSIKLAANEHGGDTAQKMELVSSESLTIRNPRLHVIRPEDRLDLVFELSNLAVHFSRNRPTELRRIDRDAKAQLIVHFAGQHLAEKTFFTTAGGGGDPIILPPVPTRLAGPSRLAFDYVGDSSLPFSLDTLLSWQRFTPSLVDPVRPPSLIAEPNLDQTAIEAPFRIVLSPNDQHRWQHEFAPLKREERTELWHTRLVGPVDGTFGATRRNLPATVRAVWSPDYSGAAPALPFETTLLAKDRKDIVTVTHDATVITTPVQARTLMLSSFGAYLDLEGRFPYDCHSPVSLERWLHQATLSQDNKVIVSRRGYLYPFGHLVSLISVSTREPADVKPTAGGPDVQGEYLRKRLYIRIRERDKEVASRADAWSLPFKSLHIDIPVTPPLDAPRGIEKSAAAGIYWGSEAFWPTVDDNLFEFPVTGLDWNNEEYKFKAPLLFIEFDAAAPAGGVNINPAGAYLPRLADVKAEYTRSKRGIRTINDEGVHVAPPRAPNDTAVDVLRIQFEGADDPQPVCPTEQAQFKVMVSKLEARFPALKSSLKDEENKAWFLLSNIKTTPAEVFLVATSGLDATDKDRIRLGYGGQADKSGGLASPSMTIGGASRLYGTFGGQSSPALVAGAGLGPSGKPPGPMGQGVFDPADYLDKDATICGCIRISDIIKTGLSVSQAQMPKVLSKLRPYTDGGSSSLTQSLEWSTSQLKNWPSGPQGIFVTQQETPDRVADSSSPTQFRISALARVTLDNPLKPTATVHASLTNFSAQLLFLGENGVLIRCNSLEFMVDETGKTSFDIDIKSVELVGEILSFIKTLQEFIAGLLGDAGISIELSSSGVLVRLPSFNLPAITMGAFNLQNLNIGSSVELSFRSEPIKFRTNFSSLESPFLISVGIYGGGGSVTVVTDIRRVVLFSASFTFGAFTTLNLFIASGSAAVLGGLTYTSMTVGTGDAASTKIEYGFFVHAYGSVTAYGFITVGVDFYLGLKISNGPPSTSEGTVRVSYSIKIGFFKKEFTLTYSKSFTGSGGGANVRLFQAGFDATKLPIKHVKLTDVMGFEDWVTYRRAFAA
jgi:hypothetical protein